MENKNARLFALLAVIGLIFHPAALIGRPEETVTLKIQMVVHREIYEQTDFGEPPQIAVWIENVRGSDIRTLWVARRSGLRLWKGKVECPTALPIWESVHQREKSDYRPRGMMRMLLDAVSGATPTGGRFEVRGRVPLNSRWRCFVEINLSGDFNRHFPYRHPGGMPDPEMNGQPSLIYRAEITVVPGQQADLILIGRSDQWVPVEEIIPDLSGITSARRAVTRIKVFCLR